MTSTGVVLVDPKLEGSGERIMDALRTFTDLPVRTIINTHFHGDHSGGNPDFPRSVEVIAHENTATLMQRRPPVTGGSPPDRNPFAEHGGRGLPSRTFTDRLTLGSGDERIELYYFGRAHTDGDAWVVFPTQRVVHTGDVFAHKTYPAADIDNGGSVTEYAATIRKAAAALTDVDTVVTGHYPTVLTLADLKIYGEFVREFFQAVQDARKTGQTADAFSKTWKVPDRYLRDGYVDVPPYVEPYWNR